MAARWQPGETVVHQEVWRDRVWAARPLTVVEDEPDRLLLWLPFGTRRKIPITPPRRPDPPTLEDRAIENLHHGDWCHGDDEWDVSTLWILRPGDWHAVWVSWRPDGAHYGWYVNFQRPFTRTPIGIEAMDLMLDIVVEPDRSWRWKDGEQFDEIVARKIFDEPTGQQVRAEAARAVRDLEQGALPFSEPWPEWRPDPGWPRPELPPGWDEVQPNVPPA